MDVDAVSRLLSLTSHELRSPLGVIRGYLKLLEQFPASLTEPQKQAVAASLRATTRMMDILAEVSAFAHLQRGDTAITRTATPLAAIYAAAAGSAADAAAPASGVPDGQVSVDMSLVGPALASVAAAVQAARPHEAVPIALRIAADGTVPAVRVVFGHEPAESNGAPLNILRGGLGLRLPLASIVLEGHGGRIEEVQQGNRLMAMVVWLPLSEAPAS